MGVRIDSRAREVNGKVGGIVGSATSFVFSRLAKVHRVVFFFNSRLDANAVTCPPVRFDSLQRVAIEDVTPAGRAKANVELLGSLQLAPRLWTEKLEPAAAVDDRQRCPSLPHALLPPANDGAHLPRPLERC
jgi:hypothetical protein